MGNRLLFFSTLRQPFLAETETLFNVVFCGKKGNSSVIYTPYNREMIPDKEIAIEPG